MSDDDSQRPWRLILKLPDGYADEAQPIFEWLRSELIPAVLHAPVRVSVIFEPPDDESVHPDVQDP